MIQAQRMADADSAETGSGTTAGPKGTTTSGLTQPALMSRSTANTSRRGPNRRDEHLQLKRRLAGGLRHGRLCLRDQPGRGTTGPEAADAVAEKATVRLGGGRPRPHDDAHGLDVAGRLRHRCAAGSPSTTSWRLSRAGAGSDGGWTAPPDGLRHVISRRRLRDEKLFAERGRRVPIWPPSLLSRWAARMMTGQTVEACWTRSRSAAARRRINCSLGPRHGPAPRRAAAHRPMFVSVSDAGLPNPLLPTGFPETPEDMGPCSATGRATGG